METTVKPFEQAIRDAGYGTQDSHQAKVILNEAEAAMAGHFMTSQLPAKGDLLVIADIGGGTCDVGAFVVDYPTDGAYPRLQPRSSGWGVDVGSSKIDEHFEDVVAARLKPVIQKSMKNSAGMDNSDIDAIVAGAIRDVSNDGIYRGAKHDFGKPLPRLTPEYFPLPRAKLTVTDAVWNELKGTLIFDREIVFKATFDEQCTKIWTRIKEQIDGTSSVKEQKPHLLLSGGMSQSVYVQNFLRAKLGQELKVADPQVTVTKHPQLVVCIGLVESELRTLKRESLWKCRAKSSLGVVPKGASGNKTTLAVARNMEIQTDQSFRVRVPVELDKHGNFELSLAEFSTHFPNGKLALSRSPPLGTPTIIGVFGSGKLPLEKVLGVQKSIKFDVDLRFFLGAIRCRVMHKKTQVGTDRYFSWPWQCDQVEVSGTSSTQRESLAVRFERWMSSADRPKILAGAKVIGILTAMGFNFAKNRQNRAPGDLDLEGFQADLTDAMGKTKIGAENFNQGIDEVKNQVKETNAAFDAVATNVGLGAEGKQSN